MTITIQPENYENFDAKDYEKRYAKLVQIFAESTTTQDDAWLFHGEPAPKTITRMAKFHRLNPYSFVKDISASIRRRKKSKSLTPVEIQKLRRVRALRQRVELRRFRGPGQYEVFVQRLQKLGDANLDEIRALIRSMDNVDEPLLVRITSEEGARLLRITASNVRSPRCSVKRDGSWMRITLKK